MIRNYQEEHMNQEADNNHQKESSTPAFKTCSDFVREYLRQFPKSTIGQVVKAGELSGYVFSRSLVDQVKYGKKYRARRKARDKKKAAEVAATAKKVEQFESKIDGQIKAPKIGVLRNVRERPTIVAVVSEKTKEDFEKLAASRRMNPMVLAGCVIDAFMQQKDEKDMALIEFMIAKQALAAAEENLNRLRLKK